MRRDPPKTVVAYCSGFVTQVLVFTGMIYGGDGGLDLLIQLLFWGAVAGALAWSVWRGSRAGWWINLVNIAFGILLSVERFPTGDGAAEEVVRRSSDDPVVVISGLLMSAVLLALLLSPSVRAWTSTEPRV